MSVVLKLNGDGLGLEREVSFTQAGKIIAFLGSDEASNGQDTLHIGEIAPTATPMTPQRQSLRELIDTANATTNPQKIAVLGNHLAQLSQDATFSAEEVKGLFPRAGEKIPKNFTRDLLGTVTAGYIEQMPNQEGMFFVTRVGETKINEGFTGNGPKRPSVKRTGSSSPQPSVSEEVSSIPVFTPDLPGYPSYHKLPTKGMKVLWTLAFAHSHGVELLRPNEIAYICGKLRDKIEPGNINGLTGTAAKNGFIAKDNESRYSLLHKGDEYLKGLTDEPGDQ